MRTKRNLAVESLERREVFTGMPGLEGFDIYDTPVQINGAEGFGTLIGPCVGINDGNSDNFENANDPNAGLISSPLGLSQPQSCHEARERLMAMVESGDVTFNQEWINSVLDTMDGGCGI